MVYRWLQIISRMVTVTNKLLIILILTLGFQSLSQADDIKDFEIEGISIGDSLLDHTEYKLIMDRKTTPYKSKKFAIFTGLLDEVSSYDGYLIHFKNDDPKFIIESLQGVVLYKKNIQECYNLKKVIVDELDTIFKNSQKEDYKTDHAADESGQSKTDNTQYTFKSGGHSRVTCTDWSDNMNYVDKLTVSVVTKEFENWIENEAY